MLFIFHYLYFIIKLDNENPERRYFMKKLNIAIIGQGRSGKDIHGLYLRGEKNVYYNVKYVVDKDEYRRGVAEEIFPGCKTFSDYHEILFIDDIDLVVNASYSENHYEITETLLANRTVVLNLEGLEVEIAQRIIDFTSGSCYAIQGNLQKISHYIFIITPASVDISGDFQEILSGSFDVPSIHN